MKLIVGIDIGNATTESTLAEVNGGDINVLSSGIVKTTGIKGTKENVKGVFASCRKLSRVLEEICLNYLW